MVGNEMRDLPSPQEMVEVPAVNMINWDWDKFAPPGNNSEPDPKDGETDFLSQLVKEAGVDIVDYKPGENPVRYLPRPKFTKNPEFLKWAEKSPTDKITSPPSIPPEIWKGYYPEEDFTKEPSSMKFEDGKWVDK
jgi:hypothetical protein